MIFMSSALPNHVGRHNPGSAAAVSVTGQQQDAGTSSYAPQPPPARPITDSSAHLAGLYSEYDASEHTESFTVPGSPIVKGSTAVAHDFGGRKTEYEVQNVPEEQQEWEALNDAAVVDQWEPEMLLMPGAGLPRNLMQEAGLSEEGLRHRASGVRQASRVDSSETGNVHELYEQALQEGQQSQAAASVPLHAPAEIVPLVPHEAPPAPPAHQEDAEPAIEPLTVKQILAFSLPALGAVLADPLMSLVDTACVGQMTSVGLAALGPNSTIFGFVSMMFMFFSTATVSMCARAFSRNEMGEMGKVVSDGVLLALLCGVGAAAVLLTCSTPILAVLNTGAEIMGPAKEYLFWRALSLPCTLVSMVGAACCLGQRDSATPLRVAGLSGLVNLVVDLYLVLGPPQMGIAGAAIATAGSQALAMVLYLWTVSRNLKLQFRLPYWSRVKPFVTAGVVLTLRSVCIMTSISLMTAQAAAMGTTSIAAHQVVVGLLTLMQFCPEPISQAAQTFLASSATGLRKGTIGATEHAATQKAGRLLMKCGAALGASLAAASYLIATRAPQIFTSDPAVMTAVATIAPQLSVAVLLYSLVCCLDGIVFASGDMGYAAAVQVVNLTAMFALLKVFGNGALGGIWMAFVVLCALRMVENATRVMPAYLRKLA